MPEFQTLLVEQIDAIAHIQINRPDKVNAMNVAFWEEIIQAFDWVDNTDCVCSAPSTW